MIQIGPAFRSLRGRVILFGHRIVPALLVAALLAYLTHRTWQDLRQVDDANVSLIAEAESYASRSRLVRKFDELLEDMGEIAVLWAHHAELTDAASTAAPLQDARSLPGVETMVWIDSSGEIRFIYTPQRPVLNLPPDPAQRRKLAPLAADVGEISALTMQGPYSGLEGLHFNVVIPESGGRLLAIVKAERTFAELLRDDSPGHAISVSWRDQLLFQQGVPAVDVQDSWVRAGMIRTASGNLFKIVHTPESSLLSSLSSPAVDAVVPLGLAIAALLGLLIYENGRVNQRAEVARKARKRLADLNRTLEDQVAQRTAQLATRNADLITITESIVHDLRTPLNAILVNLELLETSLSDTRTEDIEASLTRASSAVNNMTTILERCGGLTIASHATFARERLAMKELVAEVYESLQSAEPETSINFELGELVDVDADPTLVRILLLNLLDNARRYTRHRKDACIRVSCSRAGEIPLFCVRDNGQGMDEAQAEELFQPFTQATSNKGGMGLGLAIAQRVVNRHNGRLWATGVQGEFAAFFFTLNPDPDNLDQSPGS